MAAQRITSQQRLRINTASLARSMLPPCLFIPLPPLFIGLCNRVIFVTSYICFILPYDYTYCKLCWQLIAEVFSMFFAHIFNTFLLPDALFTTYKEVYANIPCSLYKRLHFLCTYYFKKSKFRTLQHLLSATFCKKSFIVRVQTFAFSLWRWTNGSNFEHILINGYKLCVFV